MRCPLLRRGELPLLDLCTCGSWSVEVVWIGMICDVSTCLRCGRQWSAREDVEFGSGRRSPWGLVDMPAVNAKRFLPASAQAAGEAAQRLYLIQADHAERKKRT